MGYTRERRSRMAQALAIRSCPPARPFEMAQDRNARRGREEAPHRNEGFPIEGVRDNQAREHDRAKNNLSLLKTLNTGETLGFLWLSEFTVGTGVG